MNKFVAQIIVASILCGVVAVVHFVFHVDLEWAKFFFLVLLLLGILDKVGEIVCDEEDSE